MKNPVRGLIDRHQLGKASSWLPAVALFLCLALFAMAVLVLFNTAAEPESPQGGLVTSVSAQGFQGLKRLLAARGDHVDVNRFRDGPNVPHGDLEIVTFDIGGGGLLQTLQGLSDSSDAASEDESAAAQNPADTSQASSESSSSAAPTYVDDGFVPYPEEANHLLYNPAGRVVLVVAPKWRANTYARNPRWASDPQLVEDGELRDMLGELSPEVEVPSIKDKDGNDAPPPPKPGQGVYFKGKTSVIYDDVPYDIEHTDTDPPASFVLHRADGPGQIAVGKIESLQSITGPNLTPVLYGPKGEVVLSRLNVTGGRKGTKVPVYLLSDPDVLDNAIMADPARVAAALQLIDSLTPAHKTPSASIIFNIGYTSLAFDHDLLHALSRPPYVAVPLSILILGLGLMWASFARFGSPRHVAAEPPLGRGVRILADNAARLMSLTIREARLAPAYATLVRDMVLKGRGYMQASPAQTLDDLADRIGSMCNTTHSFAVLKQEAAQVATVHQLIGLTLKLHAWKTEIERAHI